MNMLIPFGWLTMQFKGDFLEWLHSQNHKSFLKKSVHFGWLSATSRGLWWALSLKESGERLWIKGYGLRVFFPFQTIWNWETVLCPCSFFFFSILGAGREFSGLVGRIWESESGLNVATSPALEPQGERSNLQDQNSGPKSMKAEMRTPLAVISPSDTNSLGPVLCRNWVMFWAYFLVVLGVGEDLKWENMPCRYWEKCL